MSGKPSKAPPVIRSTPVPAPGSLSLMRILPAWIISAVLHVVFLMLFMLVTLPSSSADDKVIVTASEVAQIEDVKSEADLTNPEIGNDPEIPTNYDVDRLADVSVPGEVVPTEAIGVPGAPEGPAQTVPPPPGIGRGTGAGIEGPFSGPALTKEGLPGGFLGANFVPGGFQGRSAATREKLAMEGGGNAESEARVALGLQWLALHQSDDGNWSLNRFHTHAREKPLGHGSGRRFTCNCTGQGSDGNETAATAFGVLPFLAAGITHRSNAKYKVDYTKTVEGALKYLIRRQAQEARNAPSKDGYYGGGMYAHGLATIAMCEAYGLSADPALKNSAQRAINLIVMSQNPNTGGWRYDPSPNISSDTSVVGWQVMALKSGQMAGLQVPESTLKRASKWLDSCQSKDGGGYGYAGPGETPTMSAVGLLCRQYLGWNPRNPGLLAGTTRLRNNYYPGSISSMYYYYYATQVMHHMGGDAWESWNPKMRDLLISRQDNGRVANRAHQRGSWLPDGDPFNASGGRMMQTSLSLLTLEVYYRHLPLYRRDLNTGKQMASK